jgi:hypothetical protein
MIEWTARGAGSGQSVLQRKFRRKKAASLRLLRGGIRRLFSPLQALAILLVLRLLVISLLQALAILLALRLLMTPMARMPLMTQMMSVRSPAAGSSRRYARSSSLLQPQGVQ